LAEEMGDFSSASLFYLKAGDLKAAGEMELQIGNRDKAAYLFSRGGLHYRSIAPENRCRRRGCSRP
jgi:hypothetical protein